jgi:hypothetical protein
MPRTCKICAHPRRAEIVEKLLVRAVTGKPTLRALEQEYAAGKDSFERHIRVCVPATLAAAARVGAIEQGVATAEMLERYVQDAEKVRLACSRWMTDPDNPDCFSLEKRASEVMVIYLEGVQSGTPLRRKKPLQELLALVQQKQGIQIVQTESFGKAPRLVYLELFGKAASLLTLRANLWGEGKGKSEEERRDWVGWLKKMAEESGDDVMELGRYCYEQRAESRAALEEEWPGLKGVY